MINKATNIINIVCFVLFCFVFFEKKNCQPVPLMDSCGKRHPRPAPQAPDWEVYALCYKQWQHHRGAFSPKKYFLATQNNDKCV